MIVWYFGVWIAMSALQPLAASLSRNLKNQVAAHSPVCSVPFCSPKSRDRGDIGSEGLRNFQRLKVHIA